MKPLLLAAGIAFFFALVLRADCEERKVLLFEGDAYLGGTIQWWLSYSRLEPRNLTFLGFMAIVRSFKKFGNG
jgi:hypothetical protein